MLLLLLMLECSDFRGKSLEFVFEGADLVGRVCYPSNLRASASLGKKEKNTFLPKAMTSLADWMQGSMGQAFGFDGGARNTSASLWSLRRES